MFEGLEWPSWLGTPSQFALLVLFAIALIKVWPILRAQTIAAREKARGELWTEVRDLRELLRKCQKDCDDYKRDSEAKILGIERNRLQEQISLINALMDGAQVDNPQLARIRATLEALQIKGAGNDIEGP